MAQAKTLDGKAALITGAARGIGHAIARRYADEDARVVIADLNEAGAKGAAAEIGQGATGLHLDVTRQESIDAAIVTVAAGSMPSTSRGCCSPCRPRPSR